MVLIFQAEYTGFSFRILHFQVRKKTCVHIFYIIINTRVGIFGIVVILGQVLLATFYY